jgi:hypothetical protein
MVIIASSKSTKVNRDSCMNIQGYNWAGNAILLTKTNIGIIQKLDASIHMRK